MANDPAIRVLIITMKRWWIGISRLPMAMRQAGFEVAAWCPKDSFVARSAGVTRHYEWNDHANWRHELGRIVEDWQPQLIIPADETTSAFLRKLAREPSWPSASNVRLKRLLRASLGDPKGSSSLDGKIEFQRLARQLGIRTPDDRKVPDLAAAIETAAALGYPVVLKDEFAAGGAGVAICSDAPALRAAWQRLEQQQPTPSLRRKVTEFLKHPFSQGGTRRSLQRFIQGRPAFHAVVAWQGQRLGGVSALVEVANPPVTGPSCVVRLMELPEVSDACTKIIRETGMTGFAGFDFMIEDGTGRAYILECNPRPTPVSHLGGLVGADLCALLREALQGRLPAAQRPAAEQLLAFFPQELLRDPRSPYLATAHLDFPQDDGPLLAAFRERFPELNAAMDIVRPDLLNGPARSRPPTG